MSNSNYIQVFDKVKVVGEFTVLDNGCNSGFNYLEISSDLDNQDQLTNYSNRSRFSIPKGNVQRIETIQISEEEQILLNESKRYKCAVLVDIDGTLSHKGDRSPFDYSKVLEDKPDYEIFELVYLLAKNHQIIFVSGREDSCREETIAWLKKYCSNLVFNPSEKPLVGETLFMRKSGDYRSDVIVKREIFFEHIVQNYNVKYVLDDRNKVVQMWRSLGLKCLQVAEGDF